MDDGVHGQGRACTPKCLSSPERLRAGRRYSTLARRSATARKHAGVVSPGPTRPPDLVSFFGLEIDLALPYTGAVVVRKGILIRQIVF